MLAASPASMSGQRPLSTFLLVAALLGSDTLNTNRHHGARFCWSHGLPIVVAPGTTKGWVTLRPVETPRQLVIQGGFVVDDGRVRRQEQHARQLGFTDLRGYLQTRCDAGYSVPALAQELAVSQWTIAQTLATLGIVLAPRPQRLARQRRRFTAERIATLVADLGFADVEAYLQDRLIRREWLLADVAVELGAHGQTVRHLMEQAGVRRGRRTARQLVAGLVLPAGLFGDRSAKVRGDGAAASGGEGHRRGSADRGRRCGGGDGGQSRVSSAAARLAQVSSTSCLLSAAAAISAAVAALLSFLGSPPATRCRRAMASSANSGSVRPARCRWWAR